MKENKRLLEIGAAVLLVALLIAWAIVLRLTEPDREATAARKRLFAVAKVTQVLADNAEPHLDRGAPLG